jgi:PTS system beta-glucosides-specific IIC component
MAKDNKQIATDVLAAVGGADNVVSVTHCMTRLRFNLKDASIPDADAIKDIDGVIGSQWSGGQFQVIVGQNVPKVYDFMLGMGVHGSGSVDDKPAAKADLSAAGIGQSILNYLSKSMVPLIPVILTAALFKTIAAIIGPTMLDLVTEDSVTYQLFNGWFYNAGFYFLPVFLGYTAGTAIGASPVLGMFLGGILIAPELQAMVAAGDTSVLVYGALPAPVSNYGSTILPMLLSMAVLYPVEKFFKKIIPDVLATVFVPFLTMVVMVPVALCVIAPIGGWLGDLVGNGLYALGSMGGFGTFIAFVILGAAWMFLVMTGMHIVLVTFALSGLASNGYDSCLLVTLTIANCAVWGIVLGGFFKLKDPAEKGEFLGFFLSGLLGGVSEPSLYGCGFKYTRTFITMAIGGAVGAVVAWLFGAKLFVLTSTNVLMFLGYIGGDTMSVIGGLGGCAVACLVAAVLTYLFGFTPEQLAKDAELAEKHAHHHAA